MEVQWARVDGKVRSKRIRCCNPLRHPIHTSHDLEFDHISKRLKPLSEEINGRNLKVGSQSVLQALPPPLPHDCSAPTPFREEQVPSRTLDFKASGPLVSSQYLPHLGQLQLRNLLSSFGDFDDENDPYEACIKKYAAIALNKYNSCHKTSFVFVGTGPSVLGYTSAACYLHLNFKAKKNDPSDYSVWTFTEVIITNRNVSVGFTRCLGLSTSLPVEASTVGCAFCSSHDIHHGLNFFGYHNGREDDAKTLLSQTKELREFIRKCKEEGFSPRFSHPGTKYSSERYEDSPFTLSTMALNLFNSGKKGTNFELVKPGPEMQSLGVSGILTHLNFKAKNKDDPGAPVETFFAEVVYGSSYVFARFCVLLDPSNSISPEKVEVHGCNYCNRSSRVYHARCGGYLTGREYLHDDIKLMR
ncbi:unnamed protein product [Amaranthus hypochondriacus]